MLHSRVLYIGVALVLLLLTLLALAPRRELSGAGWALFRCFWPSWRFFDSAGELPVLRVRFAPNEAALIGNPESWTEPSDDTLRAREVLVAPSRTMSSLFLNGAFNLELAYFACVEALLREAESVEECSVGELVSYELVRRLVESRLSDCPNDVFYQFAVCDRASGEAYLLSKLHTRAQA